MNEAGRIPAVADVYVDVHVVVVVVAAAVTVVVVVVAAAAAPAAIVVATVVAGEVVAVGKAAAVDVAAAAAAAVVYMVVPSPVALLVHVVALGENKNPPEIHHLVAAKRGMQPRHCWRRYFLPLRPSYLHRQTKLPVLVSLARLVKATKTGRWMLPKRFALSPLGD